MVSRPLIDRLDERILEVLQADGRITNRALSEQIGLSPSACLARVRALEAAGIVTGYRAVVQAGRLARHVTVVATVRLGRHRPGDFQRFESALLAMPEVVEVHQVSGTADYVVTAVVPDIGYWRELNDRLIGLDVPVEGFETAVVLKTVKTAQPLPLSVLLAAERGEG